jgi:hypothetical protein
MSHTLVDSSRATEPADSAAEQAANPAAVDDHSDVEHGDDEQSNAEPSGSWPPSSAPVTRDGRNVVLMTTALCVLFGVTGHLVLLGGWVSRAPDQTDIAIPWQPVVGASLTAVALLSFGGFYYASLRARIAIMTSFLLTFLLLLTFVLTVRELQPTGDQTLVESLIGDFRVIVQTVVGFYFSTETVLSLTKILRAPKNDAAAIRRADRDLPAG